MVTTMAMIGIDKVYDNLMVDVSSGVNAKLVDRGTRMIQTVTGLDRPAARQLLDRSGGHVKTALVMHAKEVDRPAAESLLAKAGGHVVSVLGP